MCTTMYLRYPVRSTKECERETAEDSDALHGEPECGGDEDERERADDVLKPLLKFRTADRW